MDREVRVSVDFDAGHRVVGRDRCKRQHGHHWTITVAAKSRKGTAEEADLLLEDLRSIVSEWADRDLNEMITNFNETIPENLAPWVMERLLVNHNQLTLAEVSDGLVTAVMHREPPLR